MKKRNKEAMPTTNGRNYRIYLPVILGDKLIEEAMKKDMKVSRLIRERLEFVEKIKNEVTKI